MILLIGLIACLRTVCPAVSAAEQDEHRDFQYNSVVDAQSGRYNFAYDTGNDNEIAHSLHMQYRDANGMVRGRYGYTDPRGKLRMVEYEAGPDGFKARGDVGPDQYPHDQSPDLGPPAPREYSAAYRQAVGDDLELIPSPVQMAGWDPLTDPMGTQRPGYSGVYDPASESSPGRPESDGQSDYSTRNETSGDDSISYGAEAESYDDRYPRIIFSSSEADSGSEVEGADYRKLGSERQSESSDGASLDVTNLNLDEIREAAGSGPVRRSAGGDQVQTSSNQPYSYRRYLRQPHDHDSEVIYRPRQTHDHDSERYYQRQDYYAERPLYWRDGRPVYRHNLTTHDHYAGRRPVYWRDGRPVYADNYDYPRRIFYKDSHSQVPHEHNYRPISHNDHYHYPDRYDRNRVYHNGHYHNEDNDNRNRVYHNGHYHYQDRYGRNPIYHNGHYHFPDQYGNYDLNDYRATA